MFPRSMLSTHSNHSQYFRNRSRVLSVFFGELIQWPPDSADLQDILAWYDRMNYVNLLSQTFGGQLTRFSGLLHVQYIQCHPIPYYMLFEEHICMGIKASSCYALLITRTADALICHNTGQYGPKY